MEVPPPAVAPASDFALSVQPRTPDLATGSSTKLTVSVTGKNLSGPVSIVIGGLPAGVTVSPAQFTVTPNAPQSVEVTASATTTTGKADLTVSGSAGPITHSSHATLLFRCLGLPASSGNPGGCPQQTPPPTPMPSRRFVTVGGGMERGFYDERRHLLFATNPFLNEVEVISGIDLSVRARVAVPQPLGIDQMADGKTLVIGTLTQALYTIDEDTLVSTPHLSPNYPNVVGTTVLLLVPVAMANGKVLVIGNDEGIFTDYDFGGEHLIQWDSNTDTFTELTLNGSLPQGAVEIDNIKRSADHQWAIFGADKLYLYNSDADTFSSTTLPPDLRDVTANFYGTQFAVAFAHSVTFYDANLTAQGTATLPDGVFTHVNMQYSADARRLFWELTGIGSFMSVLDTTAFTEIGHVTTVYLLDQIEPDLLCIDSSQRAFFSSDGGVSIVDSTKLRTGPVDPIAPGFFPAAIPLNSSPPLNFTSLLPAGMSITFGGVPATVQSSTVMLPPSSSVPGPADVVYTLADGEVLVKPFLFSYGTTVETLTANMAPPIGNPTVGLFGYGLMQNSLSAHPSITVGGMNATNVATNQGVDAGALEGLFFTLPTGNPGTVDVGVNGTLGSATLSAAMTYIPSARIVPASGLLQLLYDSRRKLIFALKSNEIDVFNPATLQFQSPIVPSNAPNLSYVSMTLTPDGSKMLVTDSANNTLTILNPDAPTPNTVVALPLSPLNIVATNTGKAFIATTAVWPIEFDLSTLQSTVLEEQPFFAGITRFAATPDGSHVVGAVLNNTLGAVVVWNSADDTFKTQGFIDGLWTDATISPDGKVFAALSGFPDAAGIFAGFFDSQLHFLNVNVYPDLAPPDAPQVQGTVFSATGKTLVSPLGDSIDFFDTASGTLRGRLLTPEPLQILNFPLTSWGTLVLDSTGQTIYVISASGITVLGLPVPVDQLTPVPWPLSPQGKSSSGLAGRMKGRAAGSPHRQVFTTKPLL